MYRIVLIIMLTPTDKEFIKKEYLEDSTQSNVLFLAEKFEVSTKTIISILTHAGIYKKPGYRTKAGEKPINKARIIELISKTIKEPLDKLEGLEKCNKATLRLILDKLDNDSGKYFEV